MYKHLKLATCSRIRSITLGKTVEWMVILKDTSCKEMLIDKCGSNCGKTSARRVDTGEWCNLIFRLPIPTWRKDESNRCWLCFSLLKFTLYLRQVGCAGSPIWRPSYCVMCSGRRFQLWLSVPLGLPNQWSVIDKRGWCIPRCSLDV